jgi:hypothetical protein
MSRYVGVALGAGILLRAALVQADPALTAAPASTRTASSPVRVYMRTDGQPLTFSAREQSSTGEPTWCVTPCNAALAPGAYQLRLNGVLADDRVQVAKAGTLNGELHSREASRSAGWLALNVGGIVGGVFITAAALGGPSWAYVAGGGSLLAGGLTFLITYRADSATVSFTPSEPADVRGMPLPPELTTQSTSLEAPDRARFGAQLRGLGVRVAF